MHDVVLDKKVLQIPEREKKVFSNSFLKRKQPVGGQSGEGDGGPAVEAEDGVGRRNGTVRRLHLPRLQREQLV